MATEVCGLTAKQFQDLNQRLKQLVFCPVCRDTFKDPKILRCGHSFCASCIENVYHNSEHSNCVPCPVCRESIFPPENAISNFPKSTVIQDILDILEITKESLSPEESTCSLCDSSKVRNVCMDCNFKMCENCTCIHNRIQKDSHTVVSMSNIQGTPLMDIMNEKEKYRYCPTHANIEIQKFCVTCNEILCTQCIILHNDNHDMPTINAAAKGMKEYLASQIAENGPKVDDLKRNLETLREYHKLLESTTEETKSQIQATATELRALIDSKEQECMKVVENMFNAKNKYIHDLLEAAEIQLVMRTNLLEHMKTLHTYGTTVLLAKNKQAIQNRLEQLHQQKPEEGEVATAGQFRISFSSNDHLLRKTKQLTFGKVKDSSSSASSIIAVSDKLKGRVPNLSELLNKTQFPANYFNREYDSDP